MSECLSMASLIPSTETLLRRSAKPAEAEPTPESLRKMHTMMRNAGYHSANRQVYSAIVEHGARMLDGTDYKGLFLKGPVGVGKSFGVEILAQHFRIPVLRPDLIAAQYKEYNGNLRMLEERLILTAGDFWHEPHNIILDELGTNDNARHYGESSALMCDVLDMRYRAFLRYGVKTIVTTNLDDSELARRYGVRIDDRLNEMFYFRSVSGVSLRK